MVAPARMTMAIAEPPLPDDPDTKDEDSTPVFNAYAADGDATGEVVYVNYGMPADYLRLKQMGVDVKGKVVLARYGGGWRGIKPKVAYEHGAVACLIYSDPRDDGYFAGDVYPLGPFRPEQGVQRGSVMGAGASRRLSAVRWGVAGNIVLAWVMTIPCAGAVGALMEVVTRLPAGDAIVFGLAAAIAWTAFAARRWQMLPALDRVYDNERARRLLGWQPRHDFRSAVRAVATSGDWRSPLARAVGAKGYHRRAD
jgi:hypothetical protein